VAAAARRDARLYRDLGVQRGDRVAILANNGIEYVAAYYGALEAGAIAVPLNTAADPTSLAHYLGDSGARLLVVGPRLERVVVQAAPKLAELSSLRTIVMAGNAHEAFRKAAPSIALVGPEGAGGESAEPFGLPTPLIDQDLASIIYTSGSTGRPRGATLSHLAITSNVRSIVDYLGLAEDDRVLALLPFYYVYGKSVLNTAVAVGATVVIENRFQYPNVALDTMERERCTGFSGVPSTFAILMDRSNFGERALPDLRWVTQAGGGMSPALTRRLLERLGPRRLFVMYGATEASARLAYVPPDELPSCVGAIGRAIPNVELTVRRPDGQVCDVDEVGELTARGSNLMTGYWNDPDETARALGPFGYRTGDLARRDAAGRFWLVGRLKDMLKVGGHRVAAREIEDAILEHPAVSECAVIGRADELLGDKLEAYIVLRSAGAVDAAGLGLFLKDRLPAYKIPTRIELREALPKNASGKVMKEVLRTEP
jgi:acyl-CoA synthetase (AMP-forming)/AMP-acid ligase II